MFLKVLGSSYDEQHLAVYTHCIKKSKGCHCSESPYETVSSASRDMN